MEQLFKNKTTFFSKEHLFVLVGLAGFITHLIDEIKLGATTPPTIVYFIFFPLAIFYPMFAPRVRDVLRIILGVGIIAGMSGGHFIPFLHEGYTEGILTALFASAIGLLLVLSGIKALVLTFLKRK